MARIKFQYNPHTCRYEPVRLKGRLLKLRALIFASLAMLISATGYILFAVQYGTWHETLLDKKNKTLKAEWEILEERIAKSYRHLDELIEKDDNNYRTILDSQPLDPNIRNAGSGGNEKFDMAKVKDFPVVAKNYQAVTALRRKLDVEVQSYKELNKLLNDKIASWSSRPAIQPISNKQLDRLHMSYGLRFHPIFNVYKDHKGLDFAASKGTPVYATGDGTVTMQYFSDTYGNVIYINHGYHYETRYAHLSRFAVRPNEKVKRGQIIGYVGNTGTSVSSHLHYEILFKGQHVNPINFFQRDLSNKEYERLIELGSRQDAALD